MHYATSGGHLEVTRHLIERSKGYKMCQTTNKINLVHAAVKSGRIDMVKYILSCTKNHIQLHTASTSTGATVIHIATSKKPFYLDIGEG